VIQKKSKRDLGKLWFVTYSPKNILLVPATDSLESVKVETKNDLNNKEKNVQKWRIGNMVETHFIRKITWRISGSDSDLLKGNFFYGSASSNINLLDEESNLKKKCIRRYG